MPRPLPPLAHEFERQIDQAVDLTLRMEAAQLALRGQGAARGEIGLTGLELAYELAYLRIYLAWEVLLEAAFARFLCGYSRAGAQEVRVNGAPFARTLADAEAMIAGNQTFVSWHGSTRLAARADRYFVNSNFKLVIASASARLDQFTTVRHRVAHAQTHAQQAFDQTTIGLAGRRYAGSRPGRFLRDAVPNSTPPKRWLTEIADELLGLGNQICS